MREVAFPGLNLKFTIDRVAINIGEVEIYWYAIMIVFAFTIAILFLKRDDKKYGITFEQILELAVIMIPIAIICARLYYVIFEFEDYKQNILEIMNFRNGGLAIYGGIIGAVITIIIYCKVKKMNVLDVLDYIVPYLALGQGIGRWGNFINVEAYGIQTDNIFRMGIIENGKYIEVHPTFLYESICNIIIFGILYCIRNKRKYKGELTYIYLTLYSFVRAIIEGIRTDSLMIGTFRVSQILSIILCMVFCSVLVRKEIKRVNDNKKNKKQYRIEK